MNKKKISAEHRLILLCARIKVDSSTQKEIEQLLNNPINWAEVIETSNRHTILPLIYYNLNKIEPKASIPPDTLFILKNSYYSNIDRNTKLWKEFSSTLKSINDAGLKVILLRGIIFIEELYHNLGLRAMTDIDILIKENEIAKVKTVLLQSDYTESSEGFPEKYYKRYQTEYVFTKKISSNQFLCLEIHKALVPPRPYKIILPCLWKKAQEKTLYSQRVSFLSWEDTFFSLVLHLRRHSRRSSLKYIVDIAELLNTNGNELDWPYIVKSAKDNHIITSIYFSLYIAKELLQATISSKILKEFRPNIIKSVLIHFTINKYNFFALKKWQGTFLRFLLFDSHIDFLLYLWRVSFLERFVARQNFKKTKRSVIKSTLIDTNEKIIK